MFQLPQGASAPFFTVEIYTPQPHYKLDSQSSKVHEFEIHASIYRTKKSNPQYFLQTTTASKAHHANAIALKRIYVNAL
ncbi:hypothetical protein EMIT0P100_60279 [Pseudomonas sp. IT-P100]